MTHFENFLSISRKYNIALHQHTATAEAWKFYEIREIVAKKSREIKVSLNFLHITLLWTEDI